MPGRVVLFRLYVDWDFNDTYTDESAYLESARGDMRLTPPDEALTGGGGIISAMTLTLRNPSGRFSPLRTDGALYAYTQNGGSYHAPCYLEVSVNGGSNYYRVFTGVLKLPNESTLTSRINPTVTFEARSMEEKFLQRRASTTQADFVSMNAGGLTEDDVIAEFLDAAGVASGDMVLSSGMFTIPWAWLDDESTIEESWSVAAAAGGRLYADPDGDFRYESFAHWQTATRSTTSQFTFTRDDFQSVNLRYNDIDLYNVVTVEASPRAPGGVDVIWEPESYPVLAPGETKTLTARFDAPAYTITGLQFNASSDGGTDLTSSVTITPTYYAQRADLVAVNSATQRARLYPLRILGTPVIGGPEIEESRNSTDHGSNSAFFTARETTRTRSIRGNPYIQTVPHAATLAQFLLDRSEYPRITISILGAQGQPALRLSDRITVTDANTMTSSQTCYVIGVSWSLSLAGGFMQNIDAVQTSSMYAYDGNYFRVGTDTNSTIPGTLRRIFY